MKEKIGKLGKKKPKKLFVCSCLSGETTEGSMWCFPLFVSVFVSHFYNV